MTNDRLELVEVNPQGTPDAAIIWLHGLGADGHDFESIVPELKLPADSAIRFVFPHALMRPITINSGFLMRGWYDISGVEITQAEDEQGIRHSEKAVRALIERELESGVLPDRIVLAGFSQGGAMSLQTGLRFPKRLAGILALSTYLPLAKTVEKEAHAANGKIPIFMAHGLYDPVVPLDAGERSRLALEELGHSVEWHTYPVDHGLCGDEIVDISLWIRKVLA